MVETERLRIGLIGDPVAHSISPAMQQPALDALGIPATYELWQTPADDLARRLAFLRDPGTLGANVTVPHKLAVMEHLDDVSALARRAGAVNTIIATDGALTGDNTDVYGFATALTEVCPDAASRGAVILGAGGAARAVVLALEQVGVTRIGIVNRNPDRAARLAAELRPTAVDIVSSRRDNRHAALAGAEVLINATSLGWHPGDVPIEPESLDLLPANALVVDLTYRDTDLLRAARERGLPTLDGLSMLVHQGAKALELWTGRPPPVELMMAAAMRARAARA
ncbi:MAG: shikimate dehydrogenase [Thermomicrobiales bacterium]